MCPNCNQFPKISGTDEVPAASCSAVDFSDEAATFRSIANCWDAMSGNATFTNHGVPDSLCLFFALLSLGHRPDFDDIRERYFHQNCLLLDELVDLLACTQDIDARVLSVKSRVFRHLVAQLPDPNPIDELGLSMAENCIVAGASR